MADRQNHFCLTFVPDVNQSAWAYPNPLCVFFTSDITYRGGTLCRSCMYSL